jgi:Sulfotransferase domain
VDLGVVGAGLGRTGTHSLKLAFERLLGAPCYHMLEVLGRPDQRATWHAAVRGEEVDWADFLSPYAATVDWPAAAFWRELAERWPEAIVVLSVRDPDEWWDSFSRTILCVLDRGAPPDDPGAVAELAMINDLIGRRFTPKWRDRGGAIEAYEAHNAAVREAIDPSRLVEWRPGDGWGPLCGALRLEVPDEPFPHVNTTTEFRTMTGLDAASAG